MKYQLVDITGKRFGYLTAIEQAGREAYGRALWLCHCDCGKSTIVAGFTLRRGLTRSCGCRRNELIGLRTGRHRESSWRGGETTEHRSWRKMLERCRNPHHDKWRYYGGRGIKVCPRWLKYENFLADMGRKPSPKHSIERIDNNSGYRPRNCKWATQKEQRSNRSDA